jgi:hypothetical protein
MVGCVARLILRFGEAALLCTLDYRRWGRRYSEIAFWVGKLGYVKKEWVRYRRGGLVYLAYPPISRLQKSVLTAHEGVRSPK